MVEMLLERGANPNTHKGFNVNEQLSSGWTALLHACDTGREEMVELLLERGADPNTHKDYYTALMAVCAHKSVTWREGLVSCARLLLNKGAKVNTYDRHQMSPLLYASQNGHLPLVELLLSAEADIHKQDSREWTALCLAASKGHLQVAQLLVSRGANPKAITYMGDSPFSLALDGSHTEVADWLDSITLSQGSEAPLAKTKEFIGTRTPQPAPSQEPLPSQCVQYGELELFLLGQQLGDLLPLFRQCKVQFSDLMSLTETDLNMMGVTQPSYRRKLMAAITEVHQRQWEMPKTSNLPYGRTISCTEASVILSHLTKHTNYIKATVRYLDNQVQANPDLLDVHTQSRDVKKLTNELAAAVEAVTSFSEEVKTIEIKINKLVPGTARPGGNKNKGRSRKTAAIKLAGTTAIIVFISYCGYRLWPQ
ncbi:ankyrin repeat, SAM and basic leucine zipper domain-containing protein 1-like isoform X2 [Halichondria panicea]|uniref:ankyrin repeat, SAM and basic leucine zipper domain-containing protein 1-like isoform X2 n=1 Tax=Halichondria panicea TaxID=6063 RepID=UPI00312BBF1E